MAEIAHPEIPRREYETLVSRSRNALRILRRDRQIPLRGRDVVSALALTIADDLVRLVGVQRPVAASAAAHIAHAGEWWPDIMNGGRALIAQRHGAKPPKHIPSRVLLAIVDEAGQSEPAVYIGPFGKIRDKLAAGDRLRAVSVTEAWATLVERAAAAKINLNGYMPAFGTNGKTSASLIKRGRRKSAG